MPRIIHKPVFGIVQHVISRFVNGQRLMNRNEIRHQYLTRLGSVLIKSDWQLLWYALMETHIHLALIAGRSTLNSWLQPLHTGFAVWLNLQGRKRGGKTRGPVFAGAPKTINFSHEKAGYLAAYLHNNPVRAGIVRNAADSTWTSHRAYIGLEPAPDFLHVTRGLALTGNDDSEKGRFSFHQYVVSRSENPEDSQLSGGQIATVRNTERQRQGPVIEMYSPYITVENAHYDTQLVPEGQMRPAFEGDTTLFLRTVAEVTGVSVAQMQSACRERRIASARRTAVIAWRKLNRRTSEIAASLSIGASSATLLYKQSAGHDYVAERNAVNIVSRFDYQKKLSV